MNIDLTRIINNFTDRIEIDETIDFNDEYINTTEIRKLDGVKIKGNLTKTESEIYNLHLSVSGIMILPCALTLEDVEHSFSIEINEILSNIEDEEEGYIKINGNYIDIIPIVWQNIVLEVPTRVVSNESYKITKDGIGWKLITEDEE